MSVFNNPGENMYDQIVISIQAIAFKKICDSCAGGDPFLKQGKEPTDTVSNSIECEQLQILRDIAKNSSAAKMRL